MKLLLLLSICFGSALAMEKELEFPNQQSEEERDGGSSSRGTKRAREEEKQRDADITKMAKQFEYEINTLAGLPDELKDTILTFVAHNTSAHNLFELVRVNHNFALLIDQRRCKELVQGLINKMRKAKNALSETLGDTTLEKMAYAKAAKTRAKRLFLKAFENDRDDIVELFLALTNNTILDFCNDKRLAKFILEGGKLAQTVITHLAKDDKDVEAASHEAVDLALRKAVKHRDLAAVESIFDLADPDYESGVFSIAIMKGCVEIAELLLNKLNNPGFVTDFVDGNHLIDFVPLVIAANANDEDMVKMLIQRGAQVNKFSDPSVFQDGDRKKSHTNALICAAKNGYTAIVRLLLDSGADTCLNDSEQKTALDYARENGNQEIIAMLTK